jgi:Tfp pilus assembly protein PilF
MVFWQVRDHAFINLDDDLYVTENNYVKSGLNLESVMWSLTSLHSSNWHPLTWLSHMLDVHLFGLKPGRHHMTSVFFHVVNSLLLFFVLKRMSTDRWQSAFVAALFALHPLHVESVAWVSERKDVLSTFFGLMAIWSYARYAEGTERNWYLAALLFFILGLMSKPMLVTLPFVLLLLDIWPLGRLQIDKTAGRIGLQSWPTIRPLVAEKIPFFALTAAAIGVAYLAQKTGGSIAALEMYPLSLRFANAVVAYGNYIIKMMWPFNLTVFYPYLWKLPLWQVFTTGLALMAITVLVIKTLPTRPFMFVGWFWYLGTLVPVIGLVQVGVQAMADRYTYVPMIGLFLMVAWGIPQLARKWHGKMKLRTIMSVAVLAALTTVSWFQVRYWKDSNTLYQRALDVTSNNYVIHLNLGFALADQGRFEDATLQYKAALQIKPDFERAHVGIGLALKSQGKLTESIDYYQKLLKAKPGYAGVQYNLGVALLHKGAIDDAIPHLQKAVQIKNDYAEAYNSLGAAMLLKGNIQAALRLFRQALTIRPEYAIAQKNLNKAAAVYKKGLKPKITLDNK